MTTYTKILRKETSKREKHVKKKISIFFQIKYDFCSLTRRHENGAKALFLLFPLYQHLNNGRGERRQLYFCYRRERCNKHFTKSSITSRSTSIMLMFIAIDDYFVPFLFICISLFFHLWLRAFPSASNNSSIKSLYTWGGGRRTTKR